MTEIDDLAATIRAGLDTDERRAKSAGTIADPQRDLMPRWSARPFRNGWTVILLNPDADTDLDTGIDLIQAEMPKAVVEHVVFNDPERVLAEVASKRALLDALLAEKHHVCIDQYYTCRAATEERDGGVYGEGDQPGPCDCGRDERVHTYLTLLAQPYQETT